MPGLTKKKPPRKKKRPVPPPKRKVKKPYWPKDWVGAQHGIRGHVERAIKVVKSKKKNK